MKINNVKGTDSLIRKLKAREREAADQKEVVVFVGFCTNYAIHVHEKNANHVVGQWKYLETPARRLKPKIGKEISDSVKAGATLTKALLRAGMHIQREAQLMTPVDTSVLKASAFTCLERDKEQKSMEGYDKAKRIHEAAQAKKAGKKASEGESK